MASLVKSTIILGFARATNFALVFLGPILLVRILEPTIFGQYREFVAYSLIVISIAIFSIPSNLLYFIPSNPEKTRALVSHTHVIAFCMSVVASIAILLLGPVIKELTSFDFVVPLAIYAVLFVNGNFLESYWIARKQPKYVFYYSTLRTTARLGAVLITAYCTRDVIAILSVMIIVELIRVVIVVWIAMRSNLIALGVDWTLMKEQLQFITPVGLASTLQFIHQYIGQVAVSAQLGVLALAIYSVGSYKVPVVRIARSAVTDSIFPDLVRHVAERDEGKLQLWKRGTTAYSVVIVPVFWLLLWYADTLIPIVFTPEYAEAVPIFRVLLCVILLETVEFTSPLRAANRTQDLLVGGLLLLGTNVLCMALFFRNFPSVAILGPAVGVVAGYIVERVYLAWRAMRVYNLDLRNVLPWRDLAKIHMCAIVAVLLPVLGEHGVTPEIYGMLGFAVLYLLGYVVGVWMLGIGEVEALGKAVWRGLRRA